MKKRGPRSSSYPSYEINYCFKLVKRIYENFGSGKYYATRGEIAKIFGKSAAYMQRQISSSHQYGLLDLKTKEGYKPSQLFIKIHKPIDDDQKRKALLQCFMSPKLYGLLIEQFKNQILPSIDPLSNILLQHYNIFSNVSNKAATIFIENAKFLGLLTEDYFLRIDEEVVDETQIKEEIKKVENDDVDIKKDEKGKESIKQMTILEKEQKNSFKNQNEKSDQYVDFIPFNILLKGKRRAQIMLPNDIEVNDFDTIINWIRLMKESF